MSKFKGTASNSNIHVNVVKAGVEVDYAVEALNILGELMATILDIIFQGHIQYTFMKRIRVAKYKPKSWKISQKINQNHKNIGYFFQEY